MLPCFQSFPQSVAATNDRLLELIVKMFHRGETNRLKLANRAIAHFEASRLMAA